jgi:hypothetical protein
MRLGKNDEDNCVRTVAFMMKKLSTFKGICGSIHPQTITYNMKK